MGPLVRRDTAGRKTTDPRLRAPFGFELGFKVTQAREWRPLLNGEYPPPGPTKYGKRLPNGMVQILVHAPKEAECDRWIVRDGRLWRQLPKGKT